MLEIASTDRLLIFAPHPDDESLATGGLLQRAFSAGAAVRVIFVTSGDNNRWPQHFLERRWSIRPEHRARWAVRRQAEALAAIISLGGNERHIHHLHLPDGGLTRILMHGGEKIIAQFAAEIAHWQPTLLAMPSAEDTHPDHSAVNILLRAALARLTPRPLRRIEYIVHSPRIGTKAPAHAISLKREEVEGKLRAILCHETQMALSRRRFTAYATPREMFYVPCPASCLAADHPIHIATVDRGALLLVIRSRAAASPGASILVAFQSPGDGAMRWSLPVSARPGCVYLQDETTGELLRRATVRRGRTGIEVRIPFAGHDPVGGLFIKWRRPGLFFEPAGWREVPTAGTAFPVALPAARQELFTRDPLRAAS
jgi:LmbE family N-acetylglucosaminyl deacetylase